MSSCSCITQSIKRCRNYALDGESRCAAHIDLDRETWKKRYFNYFTWTSVYEKGKLSIAKHMLLQEGIQLTCHDLRKYSSPIKHEDLLLALAINKQIDISWILSILTRVLSYSFKMLPLNGQLGTLYQLQHLNFFFETNPQLVVQSLFWYMNNRLLKCNSPEEKLEKVASFKRFLLEFMTLQQVRRSAWYSYSLNNVEKNPEICDLFAYFLQLLKDVRAQEKLLLRQKTFLYKEELVMKVFHPSQLEKWFAMGYDIDDLDRFGW
jgi:hypothetical protein